MKLIDLSKKREVEIDFIGENGEQFLHTGTITFEMVDYITKKTEEFADNFNIDIGELTKMVNDNKKDKSKSQKEIAEIVSKGFDLSSVVKKQTEMRKEVVKKFLGDKYKEFEEMTPTTNALMLKMIYEVIENEIKELEGTENEKNEGK